MGGGKFLRGGKRPRLSTRQLVLLILAGVQLILAGLCALGLHRVRHTLITQSAAEAWRGESCCAHTRSYPTGPGGAAACR